MSFEPYPLLDFDRGLFKAKEGWISPEKSFRELRNFRLKNGRLVKRKGYTLFGYLGISVSGETLGNGGSSDAGTFSNVPLVVCASLGNAADTYVITVEDGTRTAYAYDDPQRSGEAMLLREITTTLSGGPSNYTGTLNAISNVHQAITFDDDGTGQQCTVEYLGGDYYGSGALPCAIEGDVHSSGTNLWTPPTAWPRYGDGSYDFTFASAATGTVTATYYAWIGYITYETGVFNFYYGRASESWSNPVTGDYEYVDDKPVMKPGSFYTLDGNEYLLAANTQKIWQYNATTERFENPLGSLTGTDADFIHFCPYEDIVVINNRVDAPKKYTPLTPAIADMGTNFNAAGGNDIQAAWFCFRHKNRLVYLRTKEGGTDYAQRARWTPVNDIEYSAATGVEANYYTDAPTSARITAAEIIGEELIVLFDRQSLWRLHYSGGDPFTAFQWERIDDIDGTSASMGHVSLGRALLFRGRDGMKLADSTAVYAADEEIPDDVLSWNANAAGYSYGAYSASEHEALISFADVGEDYPEHALVSHLDANRRLRGYSIYDLPFHSFGYYRSGSVPTWDEATAGYTVDELTWAPDDLIGSISLPIVLAGDRNGYVYQYADGYSDNGSDIDAWLTTIRLNPYRFRQCHLGYIDFIARAQSNTAATIYLTADYDASPHSQHIVDLTPSGTEEKVSRRVLVNRIATFHTIRLNVKSSVEFDLDAIVLWCKPAGPMRELG